MWVYIIEHFSVNILNSCGYEQVFFFLELNKGAWWNAIKLWLVLSLWGIPLIVFFLGWYVSVVPHTTYSMLIKINLKENCVDSLLTANIS